MNFHRKLPIPKEVKEEYPLSEKMIAVKEARDESIRAVFDGRSDKFILVIGPCSAEHSEPVLEYISRLRKIEEQVSDKIIITKASKNASMASSVSWVGFLWFPFIAFVFIPPCCFVSRSVCTSLSRWEAPRFESSGSRYRCYTKAVHRCIPPSRPAAGSCLSGNWRTAFVPNYGFSLPAAV